MLLFLIGGALGVLMARWSVDSLVALAVAGGYVPERLVVAVDGRVFAFSFLVSLVAGVSFGIAPALRASQVDLNEGLKGSSQAVSGGFRRHRARQLLVVSELALSLVLLVGFGLLIRSFHRVYAVSGGFDPQSVVVTDTEGGRAFSPALAFWRAALGHVRELPGVESAAVSSRPPVHRVRGQQFAVEGRPFGNEGEEPQAGDVLVSPDYFRTMGIPLLKGRPFTESDSGATPPVVIVSESLAHRYFHNQDPLGRRVSLKEHSPMSCCSTAGPVEGVWREIVGVVGDVRQANLDEQPAVTLYRPYSQIVEHDMYLTVRGRSTSDAARIAAHLRSHLLALDPSKEWSDAREMWQVIHESESIKLRRFVLILLGSFSGLALLLAALGVYGVMAHSVAERTREIGIRVALGAERPVVLRQVLGEAMMLALAGLVLGTIAALALTRFISTLLFGVSSTDAVTYLGASLLLASIALLATCIPARRATRVDPMVVLRYE
jgi:putative ABC transport system permease protein